MFLDEHAKVELTYFLNNIVHMNGKRIINSRSLIKVVYPHERTYTAEFERDIDAKNELFMCSDASESHSFIFDMKRYHVHKRETF